MKVHLRTATSLALGSATLLLPQIAIAQDVAPQEPTTEPADTSTSDDGGELGVIVVTAQKRSEVLQRVPISVSAVDAATIREARIETAADLQRVAPSTNITTQLGTVQINIRGLGYEASSPASEPSVLAFVDGVYIARPTALGAAFDDLARIEVLRGPQGTLYGRNATGGVVNLITRVPSDELEANASAEYGRFDNVKASGGVGGPLADGVKARLSGFYRSRDGDRINTLNNQRLGSIDGHGLRGTLLLDPTDTLRVALRADYAKERSQPVYDAINGSDRAGSNAFGATPADPNGYFVGFTPVATALPRSNDGVHVQQNTDPRIVVRNWGSSATVDLSLSDDISLKSITAYRNSLQHRRDEDYDGTSSGFFFGDSSIEHSKSFTQEITVSGSAGNGTSWVVGAYLFDEDLPLDYSYRLTGLARAVDLALGVPSGTVPDTYTVLADLKNQSKSLFAQATASLTDNLNLTAGLRKNWDKKSQTVATMALGANACDSVRTQGKWSDLSWRIGLDYQATPQNMVYATVSKGYKVGGLLFSTCNGRYEPETLISYEVGTKNTFLDGRLLLNASAFYYDYSDLQVNIFTATTVSTENAAQAEVYGLELEARARPLEGLEIGGTVSAIHAQYQDYTTLNPLEVGLPNAQPTDLGGSQIPHAPKFAALAEVLYSVPVGENALKLRYDVRYSSGWIGDPFVQNVGIRQPAYTLSNARIAYQFGRYEVGVFGNNIFDKKYAANRYSFGPAGLVMAEWGARATWGVFANVNID